MGHEKRERAEILGLPGNLVVVFALFVLLARVRGFVDLGEDEVHVRKGDKVLFLPFRKMM